MITITKGSWAVLVFAALFCLAAPVKAFNVMPLSAEIDVVPGESYVGTIQVASDGRGEAGLVYISDWKRFANGDREDNAPGTLMRSCGEWLTLSRSQYELTGNESIEIRYSFIVPQDATGSYWTYVMVQSQPRPLPPSQQPSVKSGLMVNAATRFAVRLVINVSEGRIIQGRIKQVEVVPQIGGNPQKQARLQARTLFENTGNTFLNARCYLEIRGFDGKTIHRSAIHEFYAFPASEWWVTMPINADIPPGEYLALAVIDYGGATRVAGETQFTAPHAAFPESSGISR